MTTPRALPGLSVLLALSLPVSAQSARPDPLAGGSYDTEVTAQEGAVYGRLRHVEGTVSLKRGDEITTDLVINDPLAPGDVFTTEDGRAEIQLADGSSLKLDADTELVLQSLSDSANQIENTTILQLVAGSLIVRADDMDSNEKRFQIDTDTASIFLLSDGLFRIDVRPDGAAIVSSRRGVAEVMAQEVSSIVRSGERITVRPGRIPGEARVFNTRINDDFDAWAASRDDALVRRHRVDEDLPAGLPEPVEPYASELSYYGHWYNYPSYGWVWRPVGLVHDWQPYLNGRWVYGPRGLIWVSYEPWGWAPYHYGRWEFLIGTGWVWIPGHVFSGAYVAWSVAPGYFGWCPLGYYDYPVAFSFRFGIHRDPWIYVHAHHLYERRVHTVIVRDTTIVREIEKKRVIVRGHPVIDPKRIKEAPRVAEELHRIADARPAVRLQDKPGQRRMPFRENERERLVELNKKRLRGAEASRGVAVGGGLRGGGRSVNVVPTERRVNVPPGRRTPTPRAVPPARGGGPGRAPGGAPGTGGVDPGGERGKQSDSGPGHEPRVRQDSLPERVIPRIIPRPRPSAPPGKQAGEQTPRREVKRTAPPSGGSPGGRPAAAPRQRQPRGGDQGRGTRPGPPPRKQDDGGKKKGKG